MAHTKKFVITQSLHRSVNYALNEKKTNSLVNGIEYAMNKEKTKDEDIIFESALNCNKETAYADMIATKKAFKNTDKRLGYHIIQSFKPDETTPEIAHKVGLEFARRTLGEDYEVVIGTHLDRKHLHNHIVFNSVSFVDGKKYRDNAHDLFVGIKQTSDDICREFGLSVIEPSKKNKSMTYIDWLASKGKRTSWQTIIKSDINDCIKQAFNFGNFLVLMEHKGYEIKQGKYLAFKPYGKQRFARSYKFGDKYTEQNIKNRIVGKKLDIAEYEKYQQKKYDYTKHPKGKAKGFKALWLYYFYLLGFAKKNQLPNKFSNVLKEDLLKFETMTKTFNFIADRNLNSVNEVSSYKDSANKTIILLKTEQNTFKQQKNKNKRIFTALKTLKMYEPAYNLYLKGYTEMKFEYDLYLKAKDTLAKAEFKTEGDLEKLEDEKSNINEMISSYASDIQHLKHEVRMCEAALRENAYIAQKIKAIEPNQENNIRRNLEHEPNKW